MRSLRVGQRVLVGHFGQARATACRRPGAPRSSSRTSRSGPCSARRPASRSRRRASIWQVALPWMPILCSRPPQYDAVALAERAVGVDAGTSARRTARCPCVPCGASGRRASTRWMMFSAMSCSPAEMKILLPVMRVAAVGLRLGLGAQQAEVGAAVRLRSGTWCRSIRRWSASAGRSPSARRRAVRVQALVGAVRQARVHRPGLVGRVQHLVEALVQHDAAGPGRRTPDRTPAPASRLRRTARRLP